MNSRAQGSMLTGFQLRWVPRIPGSICYRFLYTGLSCVGFQACRVQFAPSSCAKGSTCDEFQPHRVPFMPDSNHAGSVCYEFLCVLFLCVVNSMLVGFHACRVHVLRASFVMNSMHAGLQSRRLHAHRVLCVMNYCVLYCAEGSMSCEFLCAGFHARRFYVL